MNFNKCSRCGCFFMSKSTVCPHCEPKDMSEIHKLKSFLDENFQDSSTLESLSASTGISVKNINRFLSQENFSAYANSLKPSENMNIQL